MNRKTKRTAFTLIELLTVMAIITVLISILTPSLSGARDRARATAVRAQINAMDVGLESFKTDEGDYVPSNPVFFANDTVNPEPEMADWEVGDLTQPLQGAHLLVDAMVGRDFLGYDPKAPTAAASTYNRWDADNDRRAPYIPTDGVDITSENQPPEDSFGVHLNPSPALPTIDGRTCPVFRDKFGWPILYYRADRKANQNTPIVSTAAGLNVGDGVYDGYDNFEFTSHTDGGTGAHKIAFDEADTWMAVQAPDYGPSLDDDSNFAEFIRSFRATTYDALDSTLITHPRPVRSDRSIILSAGKDGIYGTLDDVANFRVLSEER